MTGSFEIPKDTDEPNEKGVIGYVQAGKEDGDTKSVFLCFLIDTEENANKYREDLIDTLEEAFEEEIIDDLGWDIGSYRYGVIGNFVYLGTKDAVNLFVGKENIEYKIPTTEEEIVELLEKIPHVTYTFVDENHSIFNNYPTGTKIVFLADTNVEGIIGIYFDTIENRDKEYTKAKEQIEEEFFRYVSGSNDIEVKKIDNWVIGGTANMLGYFEGTKKVYTIGAKKPSTLMDLCKIFGRKGYNGWFVEYEERDAEMKVYGMLGYFSFELKESNNLFKCYLIESQEKAMKYSDELYIKLQELLKKENLELYESEDFIYPCGIYENYVYIGTKGAVDLLLN